MNVFHMSIYTLKSFCVSSFTDVHMGRPGRTHDSQVLANLRIYRKAEE